MMMGNQEDKGGRLAASGDRVTDATHEAPAGLRPDGSVPTGAKAIAFTDGRGNRFIFPSWIISDDNPEAPSASSQWWQACLIRSRVDGMSSEWLEFDPARFPHLRADMASSIFEHGAATVLLFAGPLFDDAVGEAETPTPSPSPSGPSQ